MKILQVITNLTSGGAEKLIYDITSKIKNKVEQIDILVLFDKNNINIDDLKKKGLNVKSLSYNNRFNPLNLLNLLKLIKFIKKNKCDVVHTHLFPALYFSATATFFCNKTKFLYIEHSINNKRRKYKVLKFIEKIIYSRLKKNICISKKAEANLKACLSSKEASGKAYNIAFGGRDTLNSLYKKLNELLNKNISANYGPERAGDIRHSNASIKLAKEMLGYNPEYFMDRGLELTIEWYKENL